MNEKGKISKSKNSNLVNWLKRFKISNKIKLMIAGLLFLVVIAIFLGGAESGEPNKNEVLNESKKGYSEYVADLEERLEKVLSSVKGVQNVNVFVYVENSTRLVLAEDIEEIEESGQDGSKKISRVVTTVLTKDGSQNKEVCVMEVYPEIVGVLVVADGASNEKTRLSILNAITVLLDIENTRVEVLEGK